MKPAPDGKQTIMFPSLCLGCGARKIAQFQDLAAQYQCGTSIAIKDFQCEVLRGENCIRKPKPPEPVVEQAHPVSHPALPESAAWMES